MSSPNIFKYATKELSQDAFISWLAKWAESRYERVDAGLNMAGKILIDTMLERAGYKPPSRYQSVEVKLQEKHIDVLLILNDEFVVLIEDKTDSAPHSNQLLEYRDHVVRKYSPYKTATIYLKTGEPTPGELRRVGAAEYYPLLRKELLELLEQGREKGADHPLFLDYVDHVADIENEVSSFKSSQLADWSWWSWHGFYSRLSDELSSCDWSYVPKGDFLGLWWHSKESRGDEVYLQLEGSEGRAKLNFRISVKEKSAWSSRRDSWHHRLIDAAAGSAISVIKPRRFGYGKTMAAAELDGDFRRCEDDGRLDIDSTLLVLKEAENLLDAALVTTG